MATRQPSALGDIPSLALLLDVVEHGSFSQAAKRKGLTTSAVSKRIAQLEARVGLALLVRTTRRLAPTDAGRRLVERARLILGELVDVEEELSELSRAPRGVLRIATSVGLGQSHVGPVVSAFVAVHPDVSIELAVDERKVDLVAGRFDLAVRCGSFDDGDGSVTVKKIAPSRRVLCAAPSYLTRRGAPGRAADLAKHTCLRHVIEDRGRTWRFDAPRPTEVRVRGAFHADNPFVLRESAAAGLGIAFLPSFVVADDLRSGRLRLVLPELAAETGWVYLAFPGPRPSRLARTFADFAAAELRTRLALAT